MNQSRPSIDDIFDAAAEITSPADRASYLQVTCGDDEQIRRRVERLLEAHFSAGDGLLDSPAIGMTGIDTVFDETEPVTDAAPGSMIGRYRVLEVIGEGGMGVVYKAEQTQPVHRTVALKLIKLGMDTREVVRRFQAERQALATMDHPNVARVLDAGATDTGRPYFVMEYVPAEPITLYCDRNRLDPRQRLRLFIQACEAVHHAHQKAILHRDLKPGNILVTIREREPSVKIIDFGIAKALGASLSERTSFTGRGQLVGTPEYMSPEQADMDALDVDTRSDIYSLGVVLYELLTGALPFDARTIRGASFGEMQRIIREQEPPRPSTRLSSLAADVVAEVASRRATEPRALLGQLRSELEWIPLKAMAKDRAERYRSAAELADDARNYLEQRPLIAGPHTARYRLRKFLRKHAKGVMATATVVGVVLGMMVALIVTTGQSVRARRAEADHRRTAEQQRDRAVAAERSANEQRRTAEVLLAHAAVEQADTLDAASGAAAAWAGYAKAAEAFEHLGLSPRPAEIGLLRSYDVHPPPLMVMEGHADAILSIALSADATRAVSGSKDGTLKVWDVLTGCELRTLTRHTGWVIGVAISADGRRALSAGDDKTVRLWDLASGAELHVFRGHTRPARAVAFCPDGRRAVSTSDDTTMRLLDLETGGELRVFSGHKGGVRAVAVSPDGHLALSGSDGTRESCLKLWDLDSGAEVRTVDAKAGLKNPFRGIRAIAFLPGGKHAITGGYDHSIRKWDLTADEDPPSFRDSADLLTSLAVSADGKSMVSGGDDGSVKLCDVSSGRELRSFYGCTQGVRSVAISQDGRLVLAAGLDKRLRVWNASGASTSRPRLVREPYSNVWFTGDGLVCVAELRDGKVLSFDTETGLPLRRHTTDDPAVRSLLRGEAPPRLTRRNAADGVVLSRWGDGGAELLKIPWDPTRECSVRISHDGKLILGAQDDGNVRVWDVGNRTLLDTFAVDTGVTRAAFSRDGTRLITTGFVEYVVRVWDLRTHEQLRSFKFSSRVEVDLSSDGRRVLSGDNTGLVQLWDVDTGQEVRRFVGHGSSVTAVGYRDADRVAVTVSSDNSLRLWDVESGVLIGSFESEGSLVGWDVSDDARAVMTLRWTGALPTELRTWTLDRAAGDRRFAEQLPVARRLLQSDPDDAAALQTVGEWYAFRGVHDLAIPLLERARDGNRSAPALPLARAYWQSNRPADAAREFRRAIDLRNAPEEYLRLCLNAVEHPPSAEATK